MASPSSPDRDDGEENVDFKRILIFEVQQRPCLYDARLPSYSKRNIVNKAWGEVGAAAGIAVDGEISIQ
jgi:hypothetical protein